MGVTERPRALNPCKAIAMAICPIIVHFSTWRARSMHDVACQFARTAVRSKDAQKQLAQTSLNGWKKSIYSWRLLCVCFSFATFLGFVIGWEKINYMLNFKEREVSFDAHAVFSWTKGGGTKINNAKTFSGNIYCLFSTARIKLILYSNTPGSIH